MKVGFSFGKCVRDIVEGKVSLDDVTVIIARTDMSSMEDVKGVIDHYMYEPSRLKGLDREKCLEVAEKLFTWGRIHQPRQYGMWAQPVDDEYVWMDLFPTITSDNPTLQDAWENYRVLLKLAGDKPIPSAEDAPNR